MERLGDDAKRLLAAAGAPEANALGKIVAAWTAAVGETIAHNAWPQRLARDGTLHVATASSTWAFELGKLADDVLTRLRARLGEEAPPALRFAPGPVPEPSTAAEPPGGVDSPRPGPEEHRTAAELTAGIEDEELRRLVARAAAASLARARAGRRF